MLWMRKTRDIKLHFQSQRCKPSRRPDQQRKRKKERRVRVMLLAAAAAEVVVDVGGVDVGKAVGAVKDVVKDVQQHVVKDVVNQPEAVVGAEREKGDVKCVVLKILGVAAQEDAAKAEVVDADLPEDMVVAQATMMNTVEGVVVLHTTVGMVAVEETITMVVEDMVDEVLADTTEIMSNPGIMTAGASMTVTEMTTTVVHGAKKEEEVVVKEKAREKVAAVEEIK